MLPRLVGLAGRKRSGKDTAAAVLVEHGYTRTAFADDLKDLTARVLDVPREAMDDERKEQCRDVGGSNPFDEITPRVMLQRLGAACRETFGADFWIRRIEERLMTTLGSAAYSPAIAPALRELCFPVQGWVVSDIRYSNELELIHRLGGTVIRLNRADQPAHGYLSGGIDTCSYRDQGVLCGLPKSAHPCAMPMDRHESETALPFLSEQYDHVITAASAEDVQRQIRGLL